MARSFPVTTTGGPGSVSLPEATTAATGLVKADGTTIAVATDGTISSIGDAPTGPAGGDTGGNFPNPTVLHLSHVTDASLTAAGVAAANKDGTAGVVSMRTLGTGAQQAAAGNDPRLSDTRTPTDGSVTDAKVSAGVSASKLTTGTLPDAQLSSNVPLKNAANTLTNTLTLTETLSLSALAPPTAPTLALAGLGAGNVDNGTHKVLVTFTNAYGETTAGAASGAVTVVDNTANGQIAVSVIPLGPSNTTGRKLYMSKAGTATPLFLVATIADNTTATATINTADVGLPATVPPTVNGTHAPLHVGDVPAITGALSAITDAAAKAVLTSIIAAYVGTGMATDGTS